MLETNHREILIPGCSHRKFSASLRWVLRVFRKAANVPKQVTVDFWEAFRYWLKLGFINFGGPTGQIAIMHKALVEEKRWISEERFLHALNYCMLLPGPEAQQLAIYIGWLLHRTIGGIVAGVFFVLPSVFILLALSWIYAVHGNVSWVTAFFYGLKPAVVAIVAEAVIRIGKKTLKNTILMGVAAAAFIAIYVFEVPFPLIVLCAGLLGFVGSQMLPAKFAFSKAGQTLKNEECQRRLFPTMNLLKNTPGQPGAGSSRSSQSVCQSGLHRLSCWASFEDGTTSSFRRGSSSARQPW